MEKTKCVLFRWTRYSLNAHTVHKGCFWLALLTFLPCHVFFPLPPYHVMIKGTMDIYLFQQILIFNRRVLRKLKAPLITQGDRLNATPPGSYHVMESITKQRKKAAVCIYHKKHINCTEISDFYILLLTNAYFYQLSLQKTIQEHICPNTTIQGKGEVN